MSNHNAASDANADLVEVPGPGDVAVPNTPATYNAMPESVIDPVPVANATQTPITDRLPPTVQTPVANATRIPVETVAVRYTDILVETYYLDGKPTCCAWTEDHTRMRAACRFLSYSPLFDRYTCLYLGEPLHAPSPSQPLPPHELCPLRHTDR